MMEFREKPEGAECMVEFGEKIKQLREEKGMTQQRMAEKLYVTRQAVSRWECGARYPDLLTAKKISQILDVSIDELLSGEELKQNVEKEPILARPVENVMQTVLYAFAAASFLLMSIFGIASFFPSEALAKTPAGQITFLGVFTVCGYILKLAAVAVGLKQSMQNKLTAKITGYIMCLPYVWASLFFLATFVDMQIRKNGHVSLGGFIGNLGIPLLFAACILLFFVKKEQSLPYGVILFICLVSGGYIALIIKRTFEYFTELGFAVRCVHLLGEIGLVILLGYQAYVWNAKRKMAYKDISC